jgi:hypothetical protein
MDALTTVYFAHPCFCVHAYCVPISVHASLTHEVDTLVQDTLRKGKTLNQEAVSDAFLSAFVVLFGSWRKYMRSKVRFF